MAAFASFFLSSEAVYIASGPFASPGSLLPLSITRISIPGLKLTLLAMLDLCIHLKTRIEVHGGRGSSTIGERVVRRPPTMWE